MYYGQIEKPKGHQSQSVADAVTQKMSTTGNGVGLVDNRPEVVSQRRMQILFNNSIAQSVQKKGSNMRNKDLDSPIIGTRVSQRKIIVNDTEVNKDAILDDLVSNTAGRVHTWLTSNGMTSILKRNSQDVKAEITATESNSKARKYLEANLRNQINSILAKYNSDDRTFEDNNHFESQLIQDVKLSILRLNDIVGIDHHNGQFSRTDQSGRGKALRIYRTTKRADWNTYLQSRSLAGLLHGHGGSLGQALDYFYKSKNPNNKNASNPFYDNVIFELKFTKDASNAINYDEISSGGEGGGPRSDKLTGKKEQNDILGEADSFSVNLGACRDLIVSMDPVVRRVDEMKGEDTQYSKRLMELGLKHGQYPPTNLTEMEKTELEGLRGL
ncbi:hypothetical protein P8625_00725 [Tenacibaculum tangerinum]|uniref:Uncharacterized protein n=1 Tax=Tenacibaculum tangerinum TaxID=3038772 RepID=A0ABY8L6M2_9FLAO|nr:hypothetical protein [Tenacibaculum tangerinum]WGH75719.1 hypothetical protein P8625_00725 [Tenacibaculum tangerinum]